MSNRIESTLRCAGCNSIISGRYLQVNGVNYCSNHCMTQSLPKCAECGKACQQYYSKNGKKYCSKECLEVTLPKCTLCGQRVTAWTIIESKPDWFYCSSCMTLPKCFSCMLPDHCKTLDDGRKLCSECAKSAIYSQAEAEKLLKEIRLKMRKRIGLETHDGIKLYLTDYVSLNHKSPNYSPGHELGFYLYQVTVHTIINSKKDSWGKELSRNTKNYEDNISYSIYVLYGTPRHKLIEVMAHELGHDYMQKYYPEISDLKLKEGWAEYVASQVNILYGQSEMNERMKHNPDNIYGDGYRMVSAIAQKGGMKGIKDLFRRNSAN